VVVVGEWWEAVWPLLQMAIAKAAIPLRPFATANVSAETPASMLCGREAWLRQRSISVIFKNSSQGFASQQLLISLRTVIG
jgi:hypothetical protein